MRKGKHFKKLKYIPLCESSLSSNNLFRDFVEVIFDGLFDGVFNGVLVGVIFGIFGDIDG